VTIDSIQNRLKEIRSPAHSTCVVCGSLNNRGLGLTFTRQDDGSVQAEFDCAKVFEGYQDVLHGGIIALLIDGAMTNCMFAHNQLTVTAELSVRFRQPVNTNQTAIVRSWIDESLSILHILKAELIQDGQVKVTASGKFVKQPHSAPVETTARDRLQQPRTKGDA